MPDIGVYPGTAAARDRFVLERRGPRPSHDPWRHQGLIIEDEPTADGGRARIATVLLTGRECPWRCAMCDLWTYTTVADTPRGAIPAQVAAAREAVRDQAVPVTGMKLYNAGSFFDPRAVPETDYDAVAEALSGLSRVIVECHPSLVGPRVDRFLAALDRHRGSEGPPQLEVAMGLETAHPAALDRLNKRFTLDDFASAARALADRGVALRVFLLISPPFVHASEQDDWLLRSVDAAFSCGASVVSLVPTRPGNGAIDALAEEGSFRVPDLDDIERSFALALAHARHRGRVFVDLWDLDRFAQCPHCLTARRDRLQTMNLEQPLSAREVSARTETAEKGDRSNFGKGDRSNFGKGTRSDFEKGDRSNFRKGDRSVFGKGKGDRSVLQPCSACGHAVTPVVSAFLTTVALAKVVRRNPL